MKPIIIILLIFSQLTLSDDFSVMKIVEFNGFGEPTTSGVSTGDVLVLYKPGLSAEVVKLEILSPDDYGPRLHHAKNNSEFEQLLISQIEKHHPGLKETDRDWLLTCPKSIATKVKF